MKTIDYSNSAPLKEQAPRTTTTSAIEASAPVPSPSTAADELPDEQEWWTPADLAARLGLTANAITYHCRRLFPEHAWRNRYRLSHEQAARVYRYVKKFGAKPSRSSQQLAEAPSQAPEQEL